VIASARISAIREINRSRADVGVGNRAGTGKRRRIDAARTIIRGNEMDCTVEREKYAVTDFVYVRVDLVEEGDGVAFRLDFFGECYSKVR
jgi:hypothetical protein